MFKRLSLLTLVPLLCLVVGLVRVACAMCSLGGSSRMECGFPDRIPDRFGQGLGAIGKGAFATVAVQCQSQGKPLCQVLL
jgi:hypothetical protein